MVFYNVYSFITSLWGGSNSDLENQKLRNEPIRVVELNQEELQNKIKSLRPVDTVLARKIREDIEFNNARIDHIRTEEDIINNKPLSEMEMNKIRNASIKVFDCKSCDLRAHILNLKSIATYDNEDFIILDSETDQPDIEISIEECNNIKKEFDKPLTILDEIQAIQQVGLSGWFENRKK